MEKNKAKSEDLNMLGRGRIFSFKYSVLSKHLWERDIWAKACKKDMRHSQADF